MRVLFIVPDGVDLGGIITVTEHYLTGAAEAGFSPGFMRLSFKSSQTWTKPSKRKGYTSDQWMPGHGSGQPVHPVLGWAGDCWPIFAPGMLDQIIERANTYDVVVWVCLYGFNCAPALADTSWIRLFKEITAKQITILHDDHLWERQAWLVALEPYIRGWACVHHCSFDLADGVAGNRALIFNAHEVQSVLEKRIGTYASRDNVVLSVQTAKPWKRVNKFVLAVPHMKKSRAVLAGDGIELRYMRSTEKCKDVYFCGRRQDPDATEEMRDYRIWDNAMECPHFDYIGPISETLRDSILAKSRLLADLSCRKNSGQFNRVFVEAIRQGALTVATESFMSGYRGQARDLLRAGEHFIPVEPDKMRPKALAEAIDAAQDIDQKTYKRMMEACRELLLLFDRRLIAEQLVKLAMGESTGYRFAHGAADPEKKARAVREFQTTFKTTVE